MEFDRRSFIAGLGGASAIASMTSEAKADAIEDYMMEQLAAPSRFPTTAEIEAEIGTRTYRQGVGNLFVRDGEERVGRLAPMPAAPTLADYFRLRFGGTANHVLQSAQRALSTGLDEEIVLACLLHDVAQALIKVDHGWWGAQLFEPYVPPRTCFAIRYHQALRFYPDPANGYEYPRMYRMMFGEDYVPPPYIEQTCRLVRAHVWYLDARMVTVNDLYAFDPKAQVRIDPFVDIIGRHFRQPAAGLGYDGSPVAHMWRSIAHPDTPL